MNACPEHHNLDEIMERNNRAQTYLEHSQTRRGFCRRLFVVSWCCYLAGLGLIVWSIWRTA